MTNHHLINCKPGLSKSWNLLSFQWPTKSRIIGKTCPTQPCIIFIQSFLDSTIRFEGQSVLLSATAVSKVSAPNCQKSLQLSFPFQSKSLFLWLRSISKLLFNNWPVNVEQMISWSEWRLLVHVGVEEADDLWPPVSTRNGDTTWPPLTCPHLPRHAQSASCQPPVCSCCWPASCCRRSTRRHRTQPMSFTQENKLLLF